MKICTLLSFCTTINLDKMLTLADLVTSELTNEKVARFFLLPKFTTKEFSMTQKFSKKKSFVELFILIFGREWFRINIWKWMLAVHTVGYGLLTTISNKEIFLQEFTKNQEERFPWYYDTSESIAKTIKCSMVYSVQNIKHYRTW